ncbi:helix-turn-helix transcriptional regulator [Auraticoccus monumenti]|uniref:AraC family transcriptional regulator, L-rhamnose operon transcriptional activator RhaR n=1 Tax=Auraticoccus monumenti TaxID=675864 RepID=A0A1G6S5C6_9ACTN|nr:AraC family transcriptional regulator [Auraticoccus monumenti]SDD12100.1 AraC family transcriptional regulator, L-rhamnose operon transcriptional activator RhaR [Auraticoccus monumenti]
MTSSGVLHQQTRALAFAGQLVPVACERLRVGAAVGPHTHDFLELAVVLSGACRYVTQATRRTLSPGDVVVVRPGAWHAFEAPQDLEVYNLYVGPELLRGELSWTLDHPALAHALIHGGESTAPLTGAALERVIGWLDQVQQVAGRGPTRDDRASQRVLRLGLLACVLSELLSSEVGGPAGRTSLTREVRKVITVMEEDPAHPWTVGELARQVGLSESQLHRRFLDQVGVTPIRWLIRTRAEKAAALLAGTDLTVAGIGRAVGWPDPNYATRRFRSAYAMTPSAYRARFSFLAPPAVAAEARVPPPASRQPAPGSGEPAASTLPAR